MESSKVVESLWHDVVTAPPKHAGMPCRVLTNTGNEGLAIWGLSGGITLGATGFSIFTWTELPKASTGEVTHWTSMAEAPLEPAEWVEFRKGTIPVEGWYRIKSDSGELGFICTSPAKPWGFFWDDPKYDASMPAVLWGFITVSQAGLPAPQIVTPQVVTVPLVTVPHEPSANTLANLKKRFPGLRESEFRAIWKIIRYHGAQETPPPDLPAPAASSTTPVLDETIAQRQSTHGRFTDNSAVAQALKDVYRASNNWVLLPPYMREAFDMTAHKQGRILSGDFMFYDHWLDIGGYNARVLEQLTPPKDKS